LNSLNNSYYRVPGNGKRTLLWTDNIMGNPPLENTGDLAELREWLSHLGYIA
jgi:hypothetical protein